tara:strand:- start:1200 stop:1883 length:684 start_codon:yes stop_codon:yes gene_type:complete
MKKNFKTKFFKSLLRESKVVKNKKAHVGVNTNFKIYKDPLQFFISLARYKFVSKIFLNKKSVLEVGCSDAFNSKIVAQTVKKLDVCDIDENLLKDARISSNEKFKFNVFNHNFLVNKYKKKYDGIYLLDVLEHISKNNENKFIKNIIYSLERSGILIIGIPSLEFQKYSRNKKISGHINCKTGKDLKKFLEKFFVNVNIFSMNDEIVHTGFQKMACYLFAVCSVKKL